MKQADFVFGKAQQKDLDDLIYAFLHCRIVNNLTIPNCYRHSRKGGIWSEEFRKYEYERYGILPDELDGYNLDF